MFEVLAYVYENYWSGDACPEWEHLERKLNAVGFEADEIQAALIWLAKSCSLAFQTFRHKACLLFLGSASAHAPR